MLLMLPVVFLEYLHLECEKVVQFRLSSVTFLFLRDDAAILLRDFKWVLVQL